MMRRRLPERGLLVQAQPIAKILRGTKTWEIRGRRTGIRSPIALIQSRSDEIVGTCELVDVRGPLSRNEFRQCQEVGAATRRTLRAFRTTRPAPGS